MSDEYNREDYDDIVDFLKDYARPYENGKAAFLIMDGTTLLEAAEEIERLRQLITAWADADSEYGMHLGEWRGDCGCNYCVAVIALRKAVGR